MTAFTPIALQSQARPKLLIVDDQPINIRILSQAFSAEFQVLMATNGAKALSICATQAPDLVLLDIMMPEMDGYEVCIRLKANPITADIPVVFVTAHTDDASEERGLEVGAVDFISKPINIKIVRARIKAHIALKRQSDILRSFAFIDGLTGVRNRRYFDEHLGIQVALAQRSKLPICVIMIDVDFFKSFNDCYGHQAGDDCLRRLASVFQSCLKRPTDFVARYGGEEFVCLLLDTDLGGGLALAENIREASLACHIGHNKSAVSDWVTISVGVGAMGPTQLTTGSDLVKIADSNLYQAKHQGRNRVIGTAFLLDGKQS